MKIKSFFQIMLIMLSLAVVGCQDDDAVTAGPQGEQGPAGENGNANVIASPWIIEQFDNVPTSHTSFDISDPAITPTLLESGLVLAFGKIGTNTISIPFVYSNRSYYISVLSGCKIRFIGASVNGNNESFYDLSHVRYVIIPSGSNKTGVDYSQMGYYELMDYLGLDY